MKHRLTIWLMMSVLLSVGLTGCSKENPGDVEPSADTEANVAVFDRGGTSTERMLLPMLMGDNLYYWNGDWDRESGSWHNTSIYRRAGGGTEAVEIVALGDKELVYFTVDEGQNLYYLYSEDIGAATEAERSGTESFVPEKALYLKKDSPDGGIIYDTPVPVEAAAQILNDIEQNDYICQGTVSPSGEVIMRGSSGNLYLFDGKGEYLCTGSDGWDGETFQGADKGLVNAGDDGIFAYAVTGSQLLLSGINMANASLGTVEEVKLDTVVSLNVYSGYDRGILISDGSHLWEYDPAGKEMNMLLDWGDSGVGLQNYDIDDVVPLEDGRFYVMVTRKNTYNMELAYIESRVSSEIPEKQTILIGSFEYIMESNLAVMAEEFNKYSELYQVEVKHYEDPMDLYMELLRGNGPDGFQLINSSVLASKGVLEDLSPWFAESTVVGETDLLPSVRDACSREGKLVSVFTQFRLNGLIVGQGITDNGAWTPEEYLELGKQHPEALLHWYNSACMIMEFALSGDMESFLDRQNRECFFDGERFVNLLEGVRQVTDGKQTPDPAEWRMNACQWLHDGKILTESFRVSDVRSYLEYRDAYEGFASFAGYPSSTGAPYYCFEPDYMLAMNSASGNKEGVWAFIEFFLSEEYQYQCSVQAVKTVSGGRFPVRQDAFDSYLTELFGEWNRRVEYYNNSSEGHRDTNTVSLQIWQKYPELGEDDREMLLYMVENAHWDDTFDEIIRIIIGETGSLWTGDKTAEEVAGIIQNRVKLYLDEM